MRSVIAVLFLMVFLSSTGAEAQTSPVDAKHFNKDGVLFDHLPGWTLLDDSNDHAQQLTLARSDSDAQIRVFVQRARITEDKMADVRKKLINTYIESTAKQFIAMGAKPEQVPDSTEIGTVKAEGVHVKANLGGDPGAAKIYWALIGQRVVMLTYFGPDRDLKKYSTAWDLVRSSLQIEERKKPAAKPAASPN